MNAILLTLALALGTSPDDDAAAALALAQAAKPAPRYPSYTDACALAAKQALPLVTFVGHAPPFWKPADLVTCHAETLPGYPLQCVVVSRGGYWLATLPCTADLLGCDEAAIRAALAKAVQPVADPFDLSNQRQGPTVRREAAGDGAGSVVGYHAGHQCPTCGASQFIISGRGPGGTHTHTCPRDGTTWYH